MFLLTEGIYHCSINKCRKSIHRLSSVIINTIHIIHQKIHSFINSTKFFYEETDFLFKHDLYLIGSVAVLVQMSGSVFRDDKKKWPVSFPWRKERFNSYIVHTNMIFYENWSYYNTYPKWPAKFGRRLFGCTSTGRCWIEGSLIRKSNIMNYDIIIVFYPIFLNKLS